MLVNLICQQNVWLNQQTVNTQGEIGHKSYFLGSSGGKNFDTEPGVSQTY